MVIWKNRLVHELKLNEFVNTKELIFIYIDRITDIHNGTKSNLKFGDSSNL